MNKVIIVDCNNLCHIIYHSLKGLSHNEKDVSLIYGFLYHVLNLAKKFSCGRFIFCWDSRKSYRKLIYPEYKANRKKNLTEEEHYKLMKAYNQFDELRKEVLPGMGFSNIFMQTGYEADDLIAQYFYGSKEKKFIIVSTDNDLLQLLGVNVTIYNIIKKKSVTFKDFPNRSKWCWVDIKSIAGCTTDNVKGVKGVGEKSAADYIDGKLKSEKLLNRIYNSVDIIERNKVLVDLPLRGIGRNKIKINEVKDTLSRDKFLDIFDKYGFINFENNFNVWKEYFLDD